MGNNASAASAGTFVRRAHAQADAPAAAEGAHAAQPAEKKKLKICCACPETRKPRDECVLLHGEDKCKEAIEAHKACLRSLGFKV